MFGWFKKFLPLIVVRETKVVEKRTEHHHHHQADERRNKNRTPSRQDGCNLEDVSLGIFDKD